MNKAQLSAEVDKEIKKGTPPVDAVLNVIVRQLLQGNSVSVTGFGVFEVVHRDERIAYNPQTREPVTVPAKDITRWRPAQGLTDLLNGLRDVDLNGPVASKAPKGQLASIKVGAR